MFAIALLLSFPLTANAFVPHTFLVPARYNRMRALKMAQEAPPDADAVDFDAPLDRLVAVGDIVRTGEANDLPDHEIIVDDECYMGKDGSFDDCVDFDPVKNPVQPKIHSGEETDFDAPLYRQMAVGDVVRSGEGAALDHDPVVDDERYTGKDGSFADGVDFDP